MNIKQRALELLQDESLRGRVPSEVQEFLREVAALEPVAYVSREEVAGEDVTDWSLWPAISSDSDVAIYTITGATHD